LKMCGPLFLVFVCFWAGLSLRTHATVDTDGDGQTDSQELAAGTDPANDLSVRWRNLAAWRFEDTNFLGNAGQVALVSTNVTIVPGIDGNGARISSSNGPVFLKYRAVETNGAANLAPKRGSIWFYLNPNWFSNDPTPDSGNQTYFGLGPGHWATIIETAHFSLRIDPPGLNLVLTSRGSDGQTIVNLLLPISIQSLEGRPNRSDPAPSEELWYNGLLNYSPEGTSLSWLRASLTVTGPGIFPAEVTPEDQYISIGSAADGSGAINGVLDEVFLFNATGVFATNPSQVSAVASNTPAGINLIWSSATNTVLEIKRREMGAKDWEPLGAALGTNYFDDSALPALRYEYNLNTRLATTNGDIDPIGQSIAATRGGSAIEDRGKVVLLVDQTLTNVIEAELNGFITNLVGDGWQILRADVPRHIDDYSSSTSFQTNYYNITNIIVPFIRDNYAQFSTNIKQILIIGHATIPYSGTIPDDGHHEHRGAWPTDLYYGDVDGIWTDTITLASSAYNWNHNYPNDGKFDQNLVPKNSEGLAELEIPVSRIDFHNLPAFAPRSEADLLIHYFKKNAAFRFAKSKFAPEVFELETPVVANLYTLIPAKAANEMAAKIAPLKSPSHGDPFDPLIITGSAVIGAASGPGKFDRINDARPNEHTSAHIAAGLTSTNVAFYYVRTSFAPDWNSPDNFLRSILATTNGGLASASMLANRVWRADGLGVGMSLGSEVPEVIRTWVTPSPLSARGMELLGDATLRYPVLAPPEPVSWVITNDRVHLIWSHPVGLTPAYHVYRSSDGISGEFSRLNAAPVAGTRFTDVSVPEGSFLYMVRALEMTTTGGGTFTNISQGVFANPPPIDPVTCCIPDQETNEDVALGPIAFSLGEAATQAGLQLSVSSSDTTLVPAGNIILGGSGNSRTMMVTPAPNEFGTTLITVAVATDVLTTHKSFVLTVNPVNDPPGFTQGTDQTIGQDSGPQTFGDWATSISAGPANESSQLVTFTVSSDKSYLFADPPAVDSSGTLTFTATPDARGTTTVSIRAVDSGGTAHDGQDSSALSTFTITIGLPLDTDGDGLPDDYEEAFGLNPEGTVDDGGVDSDGDGFTDLQEFWAATHPRDSGSLLEMTTSMENGIWRLRFPTVQGRNYTVDYNDAFPTGAWQTLISNFPAISTSIDLPDIAGHAARSNRIYRVKTSDTAGNEVNSDRVGFWRLPLLGSSDSLLSMPFIRAPTARGLVSSMSGNTLAISGPEPWTSNQWVYASNTQSNRHYLLVSSGTMEGDYYPITANGTNDVILDLEGGTLEGISPGDRVTIIPYWSLGSIFPEGAGAHASQVSRKRLTEVFFPNLSAIGVNNAPSRTFYFLGTWREFAGGNVNKGDEVILPDMYVIVRHNLPNGTEVTAHGSVLPTKIRIGLRREPSGVQDVYVALPRPGPVTLGESGLFESGAFRSSPTRRVRTDELFVFQEDTPVINRAPVETYFYWNEAWRLFGSSAAVDSAPAFRPGSGVILRLGSAPDPVIWINSPNY
jgi:uncharacterized protein (TIGR02597 family)